MAPSKTLIRYHRRLYYITTLSTHYEIIAAEGRLLICMLLSEFEICAHTLLIIQLLKQWQSHAKTLRDWLKGRMNRLSLAGLTIDRVFIG